MVRSKCDGVVVIPQPVLSPALVTAAAICKLLRDDFGKVFFRLFQCCELRALLEPESVNDVCHFIVFLSVLPPPRSPLAKGAGFQ